METKYLSNDEIFIKFLADNFALTKYILAYTKRHDINMKPFLQTIKSKANKTPKNLFTDLLGSGHGFKALEEKWKLYVDKTINYEPQEGDIVLCIYFNYDSLVKSEKMTMFGSGTKEKFTDKFGNKRDTHILLQKMF